MVCVYWFVLGGQSMSESDLLVNFLYLLLDVIEYVKDNSYPIPTFT